MIETIKDEVVSSFAFNFNLRRYNLANNSTRRGEKEKVGRRRLMVSKPVLKASMASALEARSS